MILPLCVSVQVEKALEKVWELYPGAVCIRTLYYHTY